MSKSTIADMSDAEFEAWFVNAGMDLFDLSTPSDASLIALFSCAIRATAAPEKARLLIEVADMCFTLAGMALGAQQHLATRN